jgi:cellulose synthase/poly-beta-1,6-N-acetylglucosamine synthase-like glycosyltransferase
LPYFDEDIRVAVLLGGRQELYMDPVRCSERKEVHPYEIKDKVRELIPFKILIGGSGLYRASVLRKVGGFNPYLYSNEESELCFRIHKAGYKILEIPHEMITHYTVHRENTKYLWKILSRRFHLGRGQVLRYGIRDGIISKTHFNGLGMVFSFTVCLLLGLLSIILSLSLQNIIFSLIWFSFCVALFFVWVTRIKSLRIPLYYMFYLSVQTYGLIHGFLMKPKDPNNYPIDVTVLQTYAEEKLV